MLFRSNPLLDADRIFATYRPVNFDEALPLEIENKGDADLKIAVAVFNDLASLAQKEAGWSQATRVNILPERLALLRYKNGAALAPIFGNTIPYPLPTSPDPSTTPRRSFSKRRKAIWNLASR